MAEPLVLARDAERNVKIAHLAESFVVLILVIWHRTTRASAHVVVIFVVVARARVLVLIELDIERRRISIEVVRRIEDFVPRDG
jgi:dolichol kinase